MNIEDKKYRKEIIDKYLDANTTLTEEKILTDYFLTNHNIDEDELAIAQMIRMEHIPQLSNEGVEIYDKIIKEQKNSSHKSLFQQITWLSAVAASIALLFMTIPRNDTQLLDTTEIAQCIQQVINIDLEDMISVTTTPVDGYLWTTVELDNGTTKTFILSQDNKKGTTCLLAIN